MNFLISLKLLIIYIGLCLAAAFIGFSEDPDHPGKCFDKIYGLGLLSPGEEINNPEICVNLKCHEGSIIESYSCGVYGVSEGCVLSERIVAPYPKCCQREIICNNIIE